MTTTQQPRVKVGSLPSSRRIKVTIPEDIGTTVYMTSDQACDLAERLIDAAAKCLDQGPR